MREAEPHHDGRFGRRESSGSVRRSQGPRFVELQAARQTSLQPSPTSTAGTASATLRPRAGRPPLRLVPARRPSTTGPRGDPAAPARARRKPGRVPPRQRAVARAGRSEAAGRYLRTSPDEIALTDSTTMGLGMIYRGLRLNPGDEIVTTQHDFYATHVSLRAAATRSGAAIRFVRLYDDPATATRGRIVDSIARALTPRTRCLAVTWVHSSTGVKLPLDEIAVVVRAANRDRPERERVLLCADGVHAFGVEERRRSSSAATCSRPVATSGSSARAGRGCSGDSRRPGAASSRRSRASTGGRTWPG